MAETLLPTQNQGGLFTDPIKEASTQFWKEAGELMYDGPPPSDGMVHHYTSLEAALSIIEDQKIWSSSIAYLNDAHEMICAMNVLNYLLKYKSRTFENVNATLLLNRLEDQLKSIAIQATFVVSLCDDGDLLGQWRGYGAGVSIAFDSEKLNTTFNSSKLHKVTYSPNDQSEILDALIISFSTWLDEQKHEPDYNTIEEETINMLRGYFENIAAKMKNVAFETENEWRIITRRNTYGLSEYPEVHFRMIKHGIVPYLILEPIEGLLPITRVTVAPNAPPTTEFALDALLGKKGYVNVKISRSSIPFRD